LSAKRKSASCVFLSDVLCAYRRSEKLGVMSRCLQCVHYIAFCRQMEEDEAKFWDEVEKIRRHGYPKKFDVRKGGS